jgi:hypothetical protein
MRKFLPQPSRLWSAFAGIAAALAVALFMLVIPAHAADVTIPQAAPPSHGLDHAENLKQRWLLAGLMAVLIGIALWYLRSRKPRGNESK